MTQTDEAIKAFSSTVQRTLTASGSIDHRLVLPHCFILAAMIQLHWIIALEHDHLHPDYQKCLNAAIDMAEVVQRIAPGDYGLLELHIGVSPDVPITLCPGSLSSCILCILDLLETRC